MHLLMRHGRKVHSTSWLRQSVRNLSYFGEYSYSAVMIHSMLCVTVCLLRKRMAECKDRSAIGRGRRFRFLD